MDGLTFEWNQTKTRSNLCKHGVTFQEAQSVFADENARLISDPDHSVGEERFILLGRSLDMRVLVVCHCERKANRIRIISARKANKLERQQYGRFTHAR